MDPYCAKYARKLYKVLTLTSTLTLTLTRARQLFLCEHVLENGKGGNVRSSAASDVMADLTALGKQSKAEQASSVRKYASTQATY